MARSLVLAALLAAVCCPDQAVAGETPGAQAAERFRRLMAANDLAVLDIQGATASPGGAVVDTFDAIDARRIRERLGAIRSNVQEAARLGAWATAAENDLVTALAQLAGERLGALEAEAWNAENAATLYAKIRTVCDGCHLGVATPLPDEPDWARALAGTLERPSTDACGTCHAGVLADWKRSMHAAAWTDPVYRMSAGAPDRVDCRACHSTLPVLAEAFSTSREWRPRFRSVNRDDGVNCATCHLRADGTVAALRDLPDAPCRPVADPRLGSPEFCGACHNPSHGAYDEWRQSAAGRAGQACSACHGHSHAWPGGHDAAFVARGLAWKAALEGREIAIELRNLAGHKFPGEVPSRTLRIEFSATDDAGQTVNDEVVGLARPGKSQVGVSDTRLAPDEVRTVRFARLSERARRVRVRIVFQPSPLALPADWFLLGEWSGELP